MIIDKYYLSKYSPLPSNYDVTNILPYVSTAEKIWVIPIIGYDLYEEINTQVNAPSGGTLSEENATLLIDGGLWQFLSYATLLEGLPFIWTRITEAGIQLGKSDNSDSASLKDLTLIREHLRNQVEVLKEFTVKYLCDHTDSFPLFDTSVCPNCGCGCNKNKGGLFSPNPKNSIYKPTFGCVSTPIVSSTSSKVDLSNYYTKEETDARIDEKIESAITSGVDLSNYWTSAQTESAINDAVSTKLDASAYTPTDLSDYYTKEQVDSAIIYATSGIASSGTVEVLRTDVNTISGDVQTLQATKLDASAYTPTDLSNYWTSAQTSSAITSATTNMQTTTNMTQSITSGSTTTQYPSASAVYGVIPKFEVNNGVLNIITQ